jgi:hypothetical protein
MGYQRCGPDNSALRLLSPDDLPERINEEVWLRDLKKFDADVQ